MADLIADPGQKSLTVRIISSRADVFLGNVESVSSVNSAGPFDILAGHAKFVTVVEKQPVLLRLSDGTKKEYSFQLAIIRVKSDQVDIFVNPQEAGQELKEVV